MRAKDVALVRNLGSREAELWRTRNLRGLVRGGRDWGYDQHVVHLQLGSAPRVLEHAELVQFRVPKATLQRWLAGGQIAVGVDSASAKDRNLLQLEFVIKEDAWAELATHFAGRFDIPGSLGTRPLSVEPERVSPAGSSLRRRLRSLAHRG
jgi:hypothetical protein